MEEIIKEPKYKLYINNPRFKFKQNFITMKDNSSGYSDRFEVFTYSKDNMQYIISPGVNTYLIYIICISNSQIFKSLKGHNECISVLNYFKNEQKKNEEYILSVDIKGVMIIWDINNEFKIKHIINTKEYVIFSCIIVFNVNDKKEDYIITSNSYISENDNASYSKIYSLSNKKKLQNLKNTNNNITYIILPWIDKKRDIFYEIECCLGKISIINIKKNEIYHEFFSGGESEEAFTNGFVYNKNNKDYLCSSSMHGEIKFWNLENKKLENKIYSGDLNLVSMIQWSEKYVIFAGNNKNKSFKILDIDQLKIISNIGGKHANPITCIKKINHSLYGNILITSGTDKSIIIWDLI